MKHVGVAMKHAGESTFIYGQATSFAGRATIHAAPSTWHADRATSTSRQPPSILQAGTWHGDDVKSDAAPAASDCVSRCRRRGARPGIHVEIPSLCVGTWRCGGGHG